MINTHYNKKKKKNITKTNKQYPRNYLSSW